MSGSDGPPIIPDSLAGSFEPVAEHGIFEGVVVY